VIDRVQAPLDARIVGFAGKDFVYLVKRDGSTATLIKARRR
jgi:hypothetical protein